MSDTDEYGRTALHYAAANADLAQVERLLDTEDVNATDHEGWTALHFAAQAAAPAIVARLLDAGADIAAVTAKGHPAIYWATKADSGDAPATIRLLRSRGADPTQATIATYFGPRSTLDMVKQVSNKPHIRAEFEDLIND
ncbi:ankyrin repeat domain-containing protein [Nocardia sp. NPDC088792]|uniref:ankyrin repeat domain-containing protein n=1 Tax=Nocardia sp. NPDC088792 TaxID=3364332 RepID=UPI003829BA36